MRFEQEANRKLLTESERPRLFVEHLVDGLLRGDPKARAESLQIQRRNEIINADEWRSLENMNPLPDGQGQKYVIEANMTDLDAVGEAGDEESEARGGDGKPERRPGGTIKKE